MCFPHHVPGTALITSHTVYHFPHQTPTTWASINQPHAHPSNWPPPTALQIRSTIHTFTQQTMSQPQPPLTYEHLCRSPHLLLHSLNSACSPGLPATAPISKHCTIHSLTRPLTSVTNPSHPPLPCLLYPPPDSLQPSLFLLPMPSRCILTCCHKYAVSTHPPAYPPTHQSWILQKARGPGEKCKGNEQPILSLQTLRVRGHSEPLPHTWGLQNAPAKDHQSSHHLCPHCPKGQPWGTGSY